MKSLLENKLIIAVDFDGTLCEQKWPEIGAPNRDLINRLKAHQRAGNIIILWTARYGHYVDEALKWLEKQDFFPDYVNENCKEILERDGDESRKINADFYIDDKSVEVENFRKKI